MTNQEFQVIYAAALKTARLMIEEEVSRIKSGAYAGLSKEEVIKVVDTRVKAEIAGILLDVYDLRV